MSAHTAPEDATPGRGEGLPDRAGPSIRASDADRDQVVDILRDQYTEGRLALEEFTSRVAAASAARTWGELLDELRDLPVRPPFQAAAPGQAVAVSGRAPEVDLVLLIVLLVVFPPAGLAYWLICYRQSRSVVIRDDGPGEGA
jgi:Domain of unknown function (DUF1707)